MKLFYSFILSALNSLISIFSKSCIFFLPVLPFAFYLLPFTLLSQECGYIYVSPTGASSGTSGTKATPANFSYGLSLVSSSNKIIRMAAGTYSFSSTIIIPSNVTIEGGFNSTTWTKSNASPTIIYRDSLNNLANPNRLVGLSCINVSGFRLLDLTIYTADAVGDGVTVYAIYVNNCTNYVISRCRINPGDGSDGLPGTPGIPGMDGANGIVGEPGQEVGNCCRLGGIGGCCSFPGSYAGGQGGTGGTRGGFILNYETGFLCLTADTCWYNKPLSDFTNPGLPGLVGQGYGGVPGGNPGSGIFNANYYQQQCFSDPSANDGLVGETGIAGSDGLGGLQGDDYYTGGYYFPDSGSIGTNGLQGGGGGGGGGGGAKGGQPAQIHIETGDTLDYDNQDNPMGSDTIPNDSYVSGSGAGGGGGGEGGQGGFVGGGGFGAGGSFAIFVWANGINGVIRDCSFFPGQGGQGGAGGIGGAGGQGGFGGAGGNLFNNDMYDSTITPSHSCNTGVGGNGGQGGQGGNGGNGGMGSNGVSVTLYQQPGQEPILLSNMYNPFEPVVTAVFSGCSNSEVSFTTTATGNIDWVFGVGANPSSASGANVSVQYDSGIPGFRSITLVVDGVPYPLANFINIPTDFSPPQIITSKEVVCVDDNVNLYTAETASTYNWVIPGGSISSSSVQNPGNVSFSSPGLKTVILTTTSCCGTSVDTMEIEVITAPVVNIGNDTSLCFTDGLPLLDAGNPGASYQWFLKGIATGDTSQTLLTVEPGDYAVVVSYGTCYSSDTMLLEIYTELPVDLGQDILLCTSDTLPVLDAGLTEMQSYLWTMNSNPVGMNSQTIQTIGAGIYMVSVTSPTGCIGKDTVVLTIKDPVLELGNNLTICSNEGGPVLNAGNPGCTYSWTLNGSPAGTTQSLQTTLAGIYSVTVTSPSGCFTQDNFTLDIVPALNAAFTVPPASTVGATVSFTDNSSPPAISWNWNFGDGSSNDLTQNPVHVYNASGQYPVFLIVNNGTCSDTITGLINIENNCSTLGLLASFTLSEDTIYLNGLGMVNFTNTSTNSTDWLWDFGDGLTTTEQNPTHVYANEGTYTVMLTSYNYNCSTSVLDTVVVMLYPVGTEDEFLDNNDEDVRVFPNPNNGSFRISGKKFPFKKIEIVNILGEIIYYDEFSSNSAIKNVELETNFQNGIYFVKLEMFNETSGRTIFKKIIVNR